MKDVFEDDPEMQRLVAEYDARPVPEEKPYSWVILQAVLMLAGAGAMAALAYALDWSIEAAAVFGTVAGMPCCLAVLGYRPGRYRFTSGPRKGERLVMWAPLSTLHRALCALAVPLLLLVGAGCAYDKATRANEASSARRPAATPRAPSAPVVPRRK